MGALPKNTLTIDIDWCCEVLSIRNPVLVIGREHDWVTVNKFKKENNYILPFYPDTKREIFSKYAKQNIPRNFIIDKKGIIVVSSKGYNTEEFKKTILMVEELLK